MNRMCRAELPPVTNLGFALLEANMAYQNQIAWDEMISDDKRRSNEARNMVAVFSRGISEAARCSIRLSQYRARRPRRKLLLREFGLAIVHNERLQTCFRDRWGSDLGDDGLSDVEERNERFGDSFFAELWEPI